jgi:hypothetical protein
MATPDGRLVVDPAKFPLSTSPTVASAILSSATSPIANQDVQIAAVEGHCLQASKSGVWTQGASHPWNSGAFSRMLPGPYSLVSP